MDLSGEARELYRVPPAEFVSARKARAAELKRAGDSKLSVEVGTLPKVPVSVWMIDLLAFDNAAVRKSFAELAARLRDALADPDRETMSRLVAERRALVSEALTDATSRASEAGVSKVAQTVRDQLEQTLLAALADEDALAAVFSGRLIRPLESDGFEPVDLEGAVVGATAKRRRPAPSASAAAPSKRKPRPNDQARKRAIEAANHAESKAKKAAEELDAVRARRVEHEAAAARLAVDLQELQSRFEQLEAEQAALADKQSQLDRELSRAKDARRRADADARTARSRADKLV